MEPINKISYTSLSYPSTFPYFLFSIVNNYEEYFMSIRKLTVKWKKKNSQMSWIFVRSLSDVMNVSKLRNKGKIVLLESYKNYC